MSESAKPGSGSGRAPTRVGRVLRWFASIVVVGTVLLVGAISLVVGDLRDRCEPGSWELRISPPLTPPQRDYLIAFSETPRMTWDEGALEEVADPLREAVDLPIGPEGAFFVGYDGWSPDDPRLVDAETPPHQQPTSRCDWRPNEEGDALVFLRPEGGTARESHWAYYLFGAFLKPWGLHLQGTMWLRLDLPSGQRLRPVFINDESSGPHYMLDDVCGWLR